ncbi:hybrid sensor histidine kinase/response regulator [Fulvitalea axinellae]|uniref:histidine kinase n=1 Tax=Fulvitalea axinellae TaxID=1182444 RepID=A0AAU9CB15_9BACT|nr:hybrid sensor histidine kinase/response regulator [Fulvitalea axinellae]
MRILGGFIALIVATVGAYANSLVSDQERIRSLTIEEGLPDNYVTSVFQDSRGFMWVGTEAGFGRFDGYNLARYSKANIPNQFVTALGEDQSGNIFVGTVKGLGVLNPVRQSGQGFFKNKNVIGIGRWNKGMYVAFDDEVRMVSYSKDTLQTTLVISAYRKNVLIEKVGKDQSGRFWILYNDGLFELFDKKGKRSFSFNVTEHIEEKAPLTAASLYGKSLWFGTENGTLQKFSLDARKRRYQVEFVEAEHVVDKPLTVLKMTDSLGVWVGTQGAGLLKQEADSLWAQVDFPEHGTFKSSELRISDIRLSDSGEAWVATMGRGVLLVSKVRRYYRHLDVNGIGGLRNSSVNSILHDHKGNVWAGHRNGAGLAWIEGGVPPEDQEMGAVKYFETRNKTLLSGRVGSVVLDRAGDVWVATWDGVSRFYYPEGSKEPVLRRHYKNTKKQKLLPDNRCHSLFFDRRTGDLWLGTYKGPGRYSAETDSFVFGEALGRESESVLGKDIFQIKKDASDNMWFSTRWNGLYLYDKKQDSTYYFARSNTSERGLEANVVRHLIEDRNGAIWAGTGNGLYKFNAKKRTFKRIDKREWGMDNQVNAIAEDWNGILWLGTRDGVTALDKAGKNVRVINFEEGQNVNYIPNTAVSNFGGGQLLFGTKRGMIALDPELFQTKGKDLPVYIVNFKVLNKALRPVAGKKGESRISKPIEFCKEVRLPNRDNVFNIEFAALSYANPERVRYAYILEGADKSWRYTVGKNREVAYTHLPAGEYMFRVKATDQSGHWGAKEARLKVVILPPLWQTWWAYLLYAFFALLIAMAWKNMLIRDVEKKTERERKDKERAQERKLSEMKLRFFTDLSHELRTPLTLIVGPMKQVLKGNIGEDSRPMLSMVNKNAEVLLKLINQMLEFRSMAEKSKRLRVSESDAVGFLRNIYGAFTGMATQKNITFEFFAPKKMNVCFDKEKVERIVYNLLSNALKYTPEGGKVSLSLTQEKDEMRIIVSDTGIGIPAEKLENIYGRFFRAVDSDGEAEQTGSGIGLALTYDLVSLHLGTIDAESEVGKGTSFTVQLPTNAGSYPKESLVEPTESQPDSEPVVTVEEQEDSEHFQEKKQEKPLVLVAEDNQQLRGYITKSLKGEFRVLEAENGKIALDIAREKSPELILSDVMMPEMDGNELCAEIKSDADTSHIPVVLLTAYDTRSDRLKGFDSGADDYVAKPFDEDVLVVKLRNLVETRRNFRKRFLKDLDWQPEEEQKNLSFDDRFLGNAIGVVTKNLSDTDFSVEKMAGELGVSRSHLHVKLKALTGESASRFIRVIRLKEAARQLAQGVDNVSQIAYRTGFNSPAYFTKCFREHFGVTPKEYMQDPASVQPQEAE